MVLSNHLMPLHDHVVAALQGSDKLSAVSKAGYLASLTALQRLTGRGLKRVLLQPEQTLHVLKRHRCHSGRPLAASTLKSYVSVALAALKHTDMLRTKPEYRKARRGWVQAFKQLRDQVDAQYRKCRLAVQHYPAAARASYHGGNCAVCGTCSHGIALSACCFNCTCML
jgi:hypothetical protein